MRKKSRTRPLFTECVYEMQNPSNADLETIFCLPLSVPVLLVMARTFCVGKQTASKNAATTKMKNAASHFARRKFRDTVKLSQRARFHEILLRARMERNAHACHRLRRVHFLSFGVRLSQFDNIVEKSLRHFVHGVFVKL